MSLKQIFILIIGILFIKNIQAQELLNTSKPIDNESIGALALYDLKQSLKSIGYSFSRPLHWKNNDFATLGTFIAGSLALSTIDDETSEIFVKNENHIPNVFIEAGTRFGKPQLYFITNAALYGTGLFTKSEKLRKTSVLIISSSITTGIIQSFAKTAIGRARPTNVANGLNIRDFEFWSHKPGFHSFPSGHTVLSMTMAHAIAKQFDNTWSKIAVYSLGSVALYHAYLLVVNGLLM